MSDERLNRAIEILEADGFDMRWATSIDEAVEEIIKQRDFWKRNAERADGEAEKIRAALGWIHNFASSRIPTATSGMDMGAVFRAARDALEPKPMIDPKTCPHCGRKFKWLCEAKTHARKREETGHCPRKYKARPRPERPGRMTAADVADFT